MSDKPVITVMVGLPRSGKSTYTEKNKDRNIVLSADRLRYLVYNQRYWEEGEPLMWSIRGIVLKMLLEQQKDIIIDETNLLRERRAQIIKLAKSYGYKVNCVVVIAPVEECIKRAEMDQNFPLAQVIGNLYSQFEYPTEDEGFDSIIEIGNKLCSE